MENFREHKARGILSYISFFGSPILQNRERVDKVLDKNHFIKLLKSYIKKFL